MNLLGYGGMYQPVFHFIGIRVQNKINVEKLGKRYNTYRSHIVLGQLIWIQKLDPS